jgi:hypothetical protein
MTEERKQILNMLSEGKIILQVDVNTEKGDGVRIYCE